MWMLLVLAPQTLIPPFTILMVLVLSCLTRLFFPKSFSGFLTWHLLYKLVHSTMLITSSTPTSSDSVELFVVIYCYWDPEIGDPVPRVKQYPVWLFMSMWTANDASILHTMLPEPSDPRMRGRWIVARTYRTSLPSFFQSSMFGALTRLHRKETDTCRSGLTLFATYRNLATKRWKVSAVGVSSFLHASSTWKRLLLAEVTSSPLTSSGA